MTSSVFLDVALLDQLLEVVTHRLGGDPYFVGDLLLADCRLALCDADQNLVPRRVPLALEYPGLRPVANVLGHVECEC